MKIDRAIYNELKHISTLQSCPERLQDYLKELKPVNYRTPQQNSAFHLGLTFIANALNDAGKDMRLVIRDEIDIPWSTKSVKEYLFRPIMKAITGKESTRELTKDGEIDKVWEILMRELGEKHGIEYIPFPHKEDDPVDYPEEEYNPQF